MKRILVVVDMQNDFTTGPLGNAECAAVIPKVAEVIKTGVYDRIIFTQDTHQSNYLDTREGKRLPVVHCIEGTEGWEIVPVIRKAAGSEEAAKELQQTAAELDQMRNLITETAYVRFKYAVFPGFMMNKSLGKLLKKVDPALSPYNLLTGLSYKTAEMNRQMKELAEKLLTIDGAAEKILAGCSYEELTAENNEVREELENFLQENGYKSDFPDYCFTAKTWLEDKERFFQVLRPLLKNPAGEGMSQEEGLTYYQELFTKMTAGLSDRKKAEVRQLCEYYRTYHVQRERTQYLWEGCFYACRKRLKRIAGILSVPEEDLLYLRYEELQNVIRNGAVPDREREIISRRKRVMSA